MVYNEEVVIALSTQASKENLGDKQHINDLIEQYMEEQVIPEELLSTPVYVTVKINNCPLGFVLTSGPPYVCVRYNKLEQYGISQGDIVNHTGILHRSETTWVSANNSEPDSDSEALIVTKYCRYGYCGTMNLQVDPAAPDTQCAYNHSGVLCGSCGDNLSLAIGSSRCIQCPNNNYVSLVIVFAIFGFLLVIFIKMLDLTVAQGDVYGLILYANIVWTNRSILFPNVQQDDDNIGFQILRIFIAWLNLDFGIETCFIEGLDAYWKVWLQFVFPLYIWIIAGLIIIASHYSVRVTKIVGNNSVQVLATLFLLSYTKLIRTVLLAFGYTNLYLLDPNRNIPVESRLVWSFDGSVKYFEAKHAVLFVVALLVLVVLWVPYTLVLLLFQPLKRVSHLKPLTWINRWEPFFDAYFGPLKDKHRYWVGLLLLVRGTLFVVVFTTSDVSPAGTLLAIIIIETIVSAQSTQVYKKWYHSLLECSFHCNLVILAGGVLVMEFTEMSKSPVIYTSVGISFVQFLGIVLYHIYRYFVLHCRTCKRFDNRLQVRNDYQNIDNHRADESYNPNARFRESLLESVTN